MLAKWTGKVIGEMHVAGITMKDLAAEIGWHEKYLSAVMNGRRNPKGAEEKIKEGLSRCKDRIKRNVQ
jgi:Helix-turn-helix.